jgi:hypothetical protein
MFVPSLFRNGWHKGRKKTSVASAILEYAETDDNFRNIQNKLCKMDLQL